MAYYRNFDAPPPDPVVLKKLTEQQNEMQQRIILQKPDFDLKLIAGCDSSFIGEDTILSAFILLSYPDLEVVEKVWHHGPVELPYIPGFLAFREAPNLLKAYEKLQQKPDLIMVDGHGISHPRRLGIATHLGLHLNKPTMGVAKKVLVGKYTEPAVTKGSVSPLVYRNEVIANVLRTKDKVKPVFVSPGHLLDLESATSIAMACAIKHKLPEPTRLADHYAGEFKKLV
ncbi:deoxyribonuclease V [Pontibacter akesuensis]|uniref:Endonuclease V n=1 Tax=Pontibacter akesuensis TaxID=388950 RepID=A0A1I7K7L2_9BACT|nr:deoxyribonuclease V [Pontibacter akesuensis]GHA74493.1 endonuclease V [Pontibacter akesuensis]SFU93424.1 Endonuclease V [Pontibacter akesuensis]